VIKQFCVRGGMELLNLSRKAIGRYTFTLGNRQSCIDYVIVGEGTEKWVQTMLIDEEKEYNVGSDHNWVEVRGKVKGGMGEDKREV